MGDVGYAAGLLGWGSDVLGYDTERSTDHGWGPRVVVLVDADEVARVRQPVEDGLPDEYDGHAVRFGWDAQEPGHHVTVATVTDEAVARCGLTGSIDQFADNTDVLSNPATYRKLIDVYR